MKNGSLKLLKGWYIHPHHFISMTPMIANFAFSQMHWKVYLIEKLIYIFWKENFHLNRKKKNRILYSDNIERAMKIVLQAHGGSLSDSWMNILQNGLNDCMSIIKDAVRVVCLSEVYGSMLMWSHYARNHTGFCIEYDFKESDMFYKHLYPVTYTKDRYAVSKADMLSENTEWIYKTTCRKSNVWAYEKEWRIVTANFNKVMPQKLKYPNGKYVLDLKKNIKAFYLGAKISENFKEEIIQFGKKNSIDIYQMVLSPSTYELNAKKII